MRKAALVGIPLLAIVIAIGIAGHFILDTSSAAREYVQVDNARVEPHEQNAREYEYRLTAYGADGAAHDVTFKTERMLRDQAYLELRTMPVRGVVSWAEVQPQGIPQKARDALGAVA